MLSSRLETSSLRLATIIAVAGILAMGAAPPQTSAATGGQLSSLVSSALAHAPSNFTAWRGEKKADAFESSYTLSSAIQKVCPVCEIFDEYATANTDERYAFQFDWGVSKSWSRAQMLAFIQLHVGALVPSFAATQGTNDDGENWFDWSKASTHEFVYVETHSDSKTAGFQVRVGHYLPSNLHYVPYARLSTTQRDDLSKAVRNFVQIGAQNGSDNFQSLRGHASDKSNDYFDTSVTFGEFMTSCDVDGIFADESASGGTSKWFLECETPALGGDKSANLAIIQTAVAGVLPAGFTATTDPKYLGTSDYRWDRSSDTMAVEIWTDDNNDGTFVYHVQILHFMS